MSETKHSNSLLASIAQRWEKDEALCALLPYDRVFTGRVPGTESYAGRGKNLQPMEFPYCSILTSQGWHIARTSAGDISKQRLTFSIWLNDATLHLGEIIQDNLYRVYANQAWVVEPQSADIACRAGLPALAVLDCLDGGEGGPRQTTIATVKAWEVTKTFVLEIERQRQDLPACQAAASGSSNSGSSSKSKSSSEPSSSSKSSSSSNDTPEGPPLFEEE